MHPRLGRQQPLALIFTLGKHGDCSDKLINLGQEIRHVVAESCFIFIIRCLMINTERDSSGLRGSDPRHHLRGAFSFQGQPILCTSFRRTGQNEAHKVHAAEHIQSTVGVRVKRTDFTT